MVVGDVKEAERAKEEALRARIRDQARRLGEVQVKADRLRPLMQEGNLKDQQEMLDSHLDRMVARLKAASQAPEPALLEGIDFGIDAGGLAADLMHLDRLGASSRVSRISRRGVNEGLMNAWGVMRGLRDDARYAQNGNAEAREWLRVAQFHRDTVADLLSAHALVREGVSAAQIVNTAVSAAQLVRTGHAALKRLAEWLAGRGGGSGMVLVGASGSFVVAGGQRVALSAAEIDALVAAGVLSANVATLHQLAQSSGGAAAAPGGAGGSGGPPDIEEVRIRPEDLARPYPQHALHPALRFADDIAEEAARKAAKDPAFLQLLRGKNMTAAGTRFHKLAADVARQRVAQGQVPQGWSVVRVEEAIRKGYPGSKRPDLLLRGPDGKFYEFDWKTTGQSALSRGSVRRMDARAAEIESQLGGLVVSESRSWVDYVRGYLPSGMSP